MMTDEITPSTTDSAAAVHDAPAVVDEPTSSATEPTPEATTPDTPAEPQAAAPEPAKPEPAKPELKKPAVSDEDLFAAALAEMEAPEASSRDTNHRKLSKGDRIEATVIQVESDRVFVDLGTKSEGVVPLAELSTEFLESAVGVVNVGDRIQVIVIKPEGSGGEGNPIVSKKRADFEEVWTLILEKHQKGENVTANVINRVKGGLEVDLGVRGFVPATHVGNGKIRNIERFVGQPMELKIIEVDRDRKKVVLSNRMAEEEKRAAVKGKLFETAKPGDILEGTVRRLTEYGAFIDLGGIDGLLHISEMSWMRISHPKEVLKEGQELKVMVLRLDEGTGKISLGLRQVLPDPWSLIKENYRIGQRIPVTIGRLVQSGAFVKLPEGAEAFLPISEMSNRRIGKPSDVLTEGQEIEVVVIDLRPDERRMVLSMRSAGTAIDTGGSDMDSSPHEYGGQPGGGGGGFDDDDRFGRKGAKRTGGKKGRGGGRGRDHDDDLDMPIVGRVPTGGATIGERLGMLKGFLKHTDDDADDDTHEDAPEDAAEDE
jgi:4-hydroxy-3-methylbut-2-enyl diphosphate reductase